MKYWVVAILCASVFSGLTNPVYAAWECQNIDGEYRCQESDVAGVVGDELELGSEYQMTQPDSVDYWDKFSATEKRALLYKLADMFKVLY